MWMSSSSFTSLVHVINVQYTSVLCVLLYSLLITIIEFFDFSWKYVGILSLAFPLEMYSNANCWVCLTMCWNGSESDLWYLLFYALDVHHYFHWHVIRPLCDNVLELTKSLMPSSCWLTVWVLNFVGSFCLQQSTNFHPLFLTYCYSIICV